MISLHGAVFGNVRVQRCERISEREGAVLLPDLRAGQSHDAAGKGYFSEQRVLAFEDVEVCAGRGDDGGGAGTLR